MAEELDIEAEVDDRLALHLGGHRDRLAPEMVEEVVGMKEDLALGKGAVIGLLVLVVSGDGLVLVAGEDPDVGLMDVGPDVVEVEVVADVAVELPVVWVAGIARRIGPDEVRQVPVAGEAEDVGVIQSDWLVAGRCDAVAGRHYRVGRQLTPADSIFGQSVLETRIVAALGQPEAGRGAVEDSDVGLYAKLDLCLHCGLVALVEGQIGMGRGGADQLEVAILLQLAEAGEYVASTLFVIGEAVAVAVKIVACHHEGLGRLLLTAYHLLLTQLDAAAHVGDEALPQGLVHQHCAQRGREAYAQTEVDTPCV